MKTDKQPVDFTGDEHWGKGGRYVVNPVTGKREPAPPAVEEIEPAAASGSELAREQAPDARKSLARNGPAPTVVLSTQVDSMSLQPSAFLAEADPSMLRKEKPRG